MRVYRVQTAVRLTPEQHDRLLALGGSAWMRAVIEAAKPARTAKPTKRPTKSARRKRSPSATVLSPDELAMLTARLAR